MRIVYPSGVVEIDFLKPAFDNRTTFALNEAFATTSDGRDPLGASVSAFLAAVRGDEDRPAVTGEEGLRALTLALGVERAAGRLRGLDYRGDDWSACVSLAVKRH